MKKITITLIITILFFSCLALVWLLKQEKQKSEQLEREAVNSALVHLQAGAMEANWLKSDQEDSYFHLMECTFESLPEFELMLGDSIDKKRLARVKREIAKYYKITGYDPSPTLERCIAEELKQEYEKYEAITGLPKSRKIFIDEIEKARKKLR